MQCRAVGYRQVEMMTAWTIKCLTEKILPTKYLYGRNQCQVKFYI